MLTATLFLLLLSAPQGLRPASMETIRSPGRTPARSPGDSTIGMNVAGVELRGSKLRMNPSIDVNETITDIIKGMAQASKMTALQQLQSFVEHTGRFLQDNREHGIFYGMVGAEAPENSADVAQAALGGAPHVHRRRDAEVEDRRLGPAQHQVRVAGAAEIADAVGPQLQRPGEAGVRGAERRFRRAGGRRRR